MRSSNYKRQGAKYLQKGTKTRLDYFHMRITDAIYLFDVSRYDHRPDTNPEEDGISQYHTKKILKL